MDKVVVYPSEVRGLGNVVSPKSVSDFNEYCSTVGSGSDTIDGKSFTVYELGYLAGSYFTVSGGVVSVDDATFTVSVTLLKVVDDSAVSSASVSCTVNEDTTLTATTDSNGVASFTVTIDSDVSVYLLKFIYTGVSGTLAGCMATCKVTVVDEVTDLEILYCTKPIIQSGESSTLYAGLTGTVSGVENQPIGNALVELFNVQTEGLLINSPTELTKTGGAYYELFRLYDLGTGDWKLSADYKCNIESRLFFGKRSGLAQNPNNSVFVGSPNGTNKAYYGYRDTSTHATDIASYDPTSYTHMSIETDGEDMIFRLNGSSYTLNNVPVALSNADLVIGLTGWGSGSVSVKNLRFELLSGD